MIDCDRVFLRVHSVMFDVSVLELKEDRCSRQDNLFIRKVTENIHHILQTRTEPDRFTV